MHISRLSHNRDIKHTCITVGEANEDIDDAKSTLGQTTDLPGHNLTFSSSMSDEYFIKWLRSKGISDIDCKTLSGKYKLPLTTKS